MAELDAKAFAREVASALRDVDYQFTKSFNRQKESIKDLSNKGQKELERWTSNFERAKSNLDSLYNTQARNIDDLNTKILALQKAKDSVNNQAEKEAFDREIKKVQRELNIEKSRQGNTSIARLNVLNKTLSVEEKLARTSEAKKQYDSKILELEEKRNNSLISEKQYLQEIASAKNRLDNDSFKVSMLDKAGAALNGKSIGQAVGSVINNKLEPLMNTTMGSFIKIAGSISSSLNSLNNSLVQPVAGIYDQMGKMNARLYGSDKSFYKLVEDTNKTIGVSGVVTQNAVLQQMTALVDSGVTYNLEQRALLSAMQDNLVSTFNVLDENLKRLIRIQQTDTTESFMGAESLLTKFLNEQYNDTSYLSDQYDAVYNAIVDSMATMNSDQATQFNFNLQKWLGALYSVGLSSNAVSGIAGAINSLATGDLSSVSTNLLALTTQKTGTSLASYLTQGVTGNDVNKLMESMVSYLQSIAENTNSNVLKKEFGNLFGLSMADWTALSNLSTTDIGNLANYTINQSTAVSETENLLYNLVSDRMALSTKSQNIVANAKWAYGSSILNDPSVYATFLGSNMVKEVGNMLGGGIASTVASALELIDNGIVAGKGLTGLFSALGSTFNTNNRSATSVLASFFKQLSLGGDGAAGFGIGAGLGSMLRNFADHSVAGSFDMSTSMRGGSVNTSSVYQGLSETISSSIRYGFEEVADEFADETEYVSNKLEAESITLEENARAISATATNVVSSSDENNILTRDINDLYAALFENTNNPLRIAIASYESTAISQLEGVFGASSNAFSQPWANV